MKNNAPIIELEKKMITFFNQDDILEDEKDLFYAMYEKDLEKVKLLVSDNMELRVLREKIARKLGLTDLMMAIEKRDIEDVKLLINSGVDVNKKDYSWQTPLLLSIYLGEEEITKLLLENGADVNTQFIGEFYDVYDICDDISNRPKYLGYTALLLAIDREESKIVELLIDNKVDINHQLIKKKLDLSYCKNCPSDYEYSLDYFEFNNYMPLVLALEKNNIEIVNLLIEAGAKINLNLQSERTYVFGNIIAKNIPFFILACESKNIDIIKIFIEKGIDINVLTSQKESALMHVSSEDIAKLLLDNGIDVNMKNKSGKTALMKASSQKIVKLLIDNGAEINLKDNQGETALMNTSNIDVAKFLIDNGADKNIVANDGKTILIKVTERNKKDFISMLIKNNVTLDIQNNYGDTALLIASIVSDIEIIQEFIKAGATIDLTNNEGIDAIDVSEREIKKLLIKHVDSSKYQFSEKKIDVIENTVDRYKKKNEIITKEKCLESVIETEKFSAIFSKSIEGQHCLKEDEIDFRSSHYINIRLKHEINNQDKDGKTTLMIACEKGDYKFVSFLLEYDEIDIAIEDNNGNTAYMYASRSKNFGKIRALLDENEKKNSLITNKPKRLKEISNKHNPKALSTLLTKFSSNKKLKYSNHTWDSSLNYNDFMKNLKEEFEKIEDDLKILSYSLYQDIHSFLFDENIIGWSSKEIKKEIEKGILPHNISLYTTNFSDTIDNFKSLFVVKNDGKLKLFRRFIEIKKRFKSININDLKENKIDKFFTDAKRFEEALALILKDIQENSSEDKKEIVVEADTISIDDTELIEIKVIHVNSTSSKTAEALKKTIDKNGGNFQTIYKNLISVCDWSIETICKDGKRYRIDYLYPEIDNTKPHYTQIDDEIRGFTHILRFYI